MQQVEQKIGWWKGVSSRLLAVIIHDNEKAVTVKHHLGRRFSPQTRATKLKAVNLRRRSCTELGYSNHIGQRDFRGFNSDE